MGSRTECRLSSQGGSGAREGAVDVGLAGGADRARHDEHREERGKSGSA